MKTTKEILALTDDELLAHPRVVAAYRGLGLKINPMQGILYPVHVPGPIEKVAFQMRDACDGSKGMYWATELDKVFDANRRRSSAHLLANSTTKQWIIAGMLAWEAKS